MKIFISYGHDCTEFVHRFREDLEKLGHDIWMDVSRLRRGTDWRNDIAEGIIHCQVSLIFLSAHSLRAGGVCLDEIRISAACNRRIMRPILMEKGIEDKIPAVVREHQYFDCSDWRSHTEDEAWYQRAVAPILEEILRMESDPYDAQMETIRTVLRPNILRTRYLQELSKPYCARNWLDKRIARWLEHSGSEPLLLIGFPGAGKSNYFSHYSQFSPNVVSLILCEWSRSPDSGTKQVIRNISYQIAGRITSFRSRLLWSLNSGTISINSMTEEELFDTLITEPFEYEIDGDREPLLIVLDGVDMMTRAGENDLARIISEKSPLLPSFVHFVIAARKDSTVLRHHSAAHIIELLPGDRNVREDIIHYLTDQLEPLLAAGAVPVRIGQIADICEGSFLLAYLIAAGIRQGGIGIDDARIPSDVHSIYFEWMSRLVSEDDYAGEYYGAFAILAAMDKPVAAALFRESLGWNAVRLNAFLRRFRTFLNEEKDPYGDKCLSLYHHSFRSWLTDEDGAADIYTASAEDGYELLGKGAWSLWEKGKLPDGEIPYLRSYLVLSEMFPELRELLRGDDYLRKLMELAGEATEKLQLYTVSDSILRQCEEICRKKGDSPYARRVKEAGIPLLRAEGYFDAGDFTCAVRQLTPALPGIMKHGTPEERMQGLYMLGTSCDLLGKRTESVEYFEKLIRLSDEQGAAIYRYRALVGLAWNGHFTDVSKMNETLGELERALTGEEEREKRLIGLVMARALLSMGDLHRALSLFSDVLGTADETIWGFSHLAIRSQMLLIESLTACYDNEEFDLGIRYGQEIYGHLEGCGTIAECYCASWIANNYLANGNTEQADYYLRRAEALNREANSSPSSGWMSMHLTSSRGFWLAETGEYAEAFRHHKQTAEMAVRCADPWVQGDALFEMILLNLFDGAGEEGEAAGLYEELANIAESSGLPHLGFKSLLVKALLAEHPEEGVLEELLKTVLENSLAATDMVRCADLCRMAAVRGKRTDIAEKLTGFMRTEIGNICRKNPAGAYGSRKRIKNISERPDR